MTETLVPFSRTAAAYENIRLRSPRHICGKTFMESCTLTYLCLLRGHHALMDGAVATRSTFDDYLRSPVARSVS